VSFHNLSSAGLLITLVATSAQAAQQDITVSTPVTPGVCPANSPINYKGNPGVAVAPADQPIAVSGAGTAQVQWVFTDIGQCTVIDPPNNSTIKCVGDLTVKIPQNSMDPINGTVDNSLKASLTGTPVAADLNLPTQNVTVKVISTDGKCGTRTYPLSVVNAAQGGGWGDPHVTARDIKYDFQSAGEFTALTEDGFEVQTRQRPVPTTTVPGPSDYTGLAVCVATYSAVAMQIGSNRVTLQPNLSGQPDPSGLQLRVNGQLVTLTDRGIDLRAGGGAIEGRITQGFGGAYVFEDAHGTQLVATPQFWDSQRTWYMNLAIYQTTASKGIWGRLARDSWLPALRDGSSLGPKPAALDQRYQDLYLKFANSWRVTDKTSLFDYAQGTSTATFTVAAWPQPSSNGEFSSCLIQGQTPADPATPQVAAQACSGVSDPAQKANCIFDVTVTGNTGFAKSYEVMQGFKSRGPGWQPTLAGVGQPPGWPWWWWILILILVLIILAVLIARKKKTV